MTDRGYVPTIRQVPDLADVEFWREDDFPFTLTFTDPETGDPLDLSSHTLSATIGDQTATLDETDAATGVIVVSLDDTQTAAFTGETWRFRWTLNDRTRTVIAGEARALS